MPGIALLLSTLAASASPPAQAEGPRPQCVIDVYVKTNDVPAALYRNFVDSVFDAVTEWNTGTDANVHLAFVTWDHPTGEVDGAIGVTALSLRELWYTQEDQLGAARMRSPADTDVGVHRSVVLLDTQEPYCPYNTARTDCIDLYNVAMHELGHTFGMEHSLDPASVMYPYSVPGPRKPLTAEDRRELARLYPWGERIGCVRVPGEGLTWAILK